MWRSCEGVKEQHPSPMDRMIYADMLYITIPIKVYTKKSKTLI